MGLSLRRHSFRAGITSHALTSACLGAAADAPQTPVTFPQPRPHYRAPTPHTPCSASTVSCPPFSASLTHAQLRPAILTALAIHRPRSRSALDLSKMLWPENTPMRKAMNTMVTAPLCLVHIDTCHADWSLVPQSCFLLHHLYC